jgi:hypothetical protein
MRWTCLSLLLVSLSLPGTAQDAPQPPASAEISADLGNCSALITVTSGDAKPVLNAKVTTRIQYGLMGVKKLDLEAFTGSDGKVKIAKLPDSLKKPMYIHIRKDDKEEMVEFKPGLRCHATFDVHLN